MGKEQRLEVGEVCKCGAVQGEVRRACYRFLPGVGGREGPVP